jgi:hypothetical protein
MKRKKKINKDKIKIHQLIEVETGKKKWRKLIV